MKGKISKIKNREITENSFQGSGIMYNSLQSTVDLQLLEKEMVKSIVDGYFKCKTFFSEHRDHKDPQVQEEKTEFLEKLSQEFLDNFSAHPSVLKDSYSMEIISKWHYVPIRVRDGGFMYPYTFTRYMDRLYDVNILPIKEIDLKELDTFMRRFYIVENLESFFLAFFEVIKSLEIPLRDRDVNLLQLLTNVQFLQKDSEGNNRIRRPEQNEILKALDLTKRKWMRVQRSNDFFDKFKIVSMNIILNPAKVGFYYALLEYPNNHPDRELLSPYIQVDVEFRGNRLAVVCVPIGNRDELLENFSYTPLTDWKWNFNYDKFENNKDVRRRWNFTVPDFITPTRTNIEEIHWDLTRPYKDEFSDKEIDILKGLSKNTLKTLSMGQLSEESGHGSVRYYLQKFAENQVYQLYPHIGHLGIKDMVVVKLHAKDTDQYQSLQHDFLSFPEAHIFTNPKDNLIVGVVYIPDTHVSRVADRFHLLEFSQNRNMDIEYELMPKDKMFTKRIPLYQIDFSVKQGEAFII